MRNIIRMLSFEYIGVEQIEETRFLVLVPFADKREEAKEELDLLVSEGVIGQPKENADGWWLPIGTAFAS